MEFVGLNGYVNEGSSYISFSIEGGENKNSMGDQVWFSKDGKEMEILEHADDDVFEDVERLFVKDKMAFRGAMRRMGVSYYNN